MIVFRKLQLPSFPKINRSLTTNFEDCRRFPKITRGLSKDSRLSNVVERSGSVSVRLRRLPKITCIIQMPQVCQYYKRKTTRWLKNDFQPVLRILSTLMFINLKPFKFFFQDLHWSLNLRSCFIAWYGKERSIRLRPLRTHNCSVFETLNLRHVSSCEMFTFCDVLHETGKRKTQSNSPECVVRNGNHLRRIEFYFLV